MHFLKCMISFPLNSSISFPPASSDQLWSPAHCPYSRGIGLHAKTQPNIFDLRVFRCICFFDGKQFGYMGVCMEIRVAHTVIDSIMSRIVFHTFQFCLYISRPCDILLRAVRVQELTSETVSLCLSTSIFHTTSSWYPYSESPDDHKTNSFAIVFSLMATRWLFSLI